MSWLRRLFALLRPADPQPDRSSTAGPDTDELREAQELRAENRRHVDAIERHVRTVSERIRDEAMAANLRAAGRR